MRIPIDPPPFPDLLLTLSRNALLPAIVFLTSRRACDEAVEACRSGQLPDLGREQVARIEAVVDRFGEEADFIRRHRHFPALLRRGVAAHHAGHLPAWKHVVEKLMSAGLLRAVFATSTLAAGIDMPARSVVITASSLRSDEGHRDIKSFELAQMTGRAGRRGKDLVGFAVFIPGPFQDIHVIAEKLAQPPEPIASSFAANYTMVLNLLQQLSPESARELVERSFRQFQNIKLAEKLRPRVETLAAQLAEDAALCPAGDRPKTYRRYSDLEREQARTRKHLKRLRRYPDMEDDPETRDLVSQGLAETERQLAAYGEQLAELPCGTCPHLRKCPPKATEIARRREEFDRVKARLDAFEHGLWEAFSDCVRVLQSHGYVDEEWRPTDQGIWAAKLRVENTLYIAELLREGVFSSSSPRLLAAVCGGLAAEDREFPTSPTKPEDFLKPLKHAMRIARSIEVVQEASNVYCPMWVDPDAARLLWVWADARIEWNELLNRTEATEGDIVRLILRTSDLLGQLAGLSESHPETAGLARDAIRLIRRPPVED